MDALHSVDEIEINKDEGLICGEWISNIYHHDKNVSFDFNDRLFDDFPEKIINEWLILDFDKCYYEDTIHRELTKYMFNIWNNKTHIHYSHVIKILNKFKKIKKSTNDGLWHGCYWQYGYLTLELED